MGKHNMSINLRNIASKIVGDKEKLFAIFNNLGLSRSLHFFKRGHLTILTLHHISDERDYFFDPISPRAFDGGLNQLDISLANSSFSDGKRQHNCPISEKINGRQQKMKKSEKSFWPGEFDRKIG